MRLSRASLCPSEQTEEFPVPIRKFSAYFFEAFSKFGSSLFPPEQLSGGFVPLLQVGWERLLKYLCPAALRKLPLCLAGKMFIHD